MTGLGRSAEFDEQRRSLFGANATGYGDGRPGYPGEVFELLSRHYGLGPGCRVLEIGPGAGQATGPMLDAGAEVVAVDIGEGFSEPLLTKYGNRPLQLILGDFEVVELPIEPVDLVVAATSFHWIQPASGLTRVADLLRPGGSVVLLWTHYGDEDRADPFRDALQPILLRHAPQLADNPETGGAGFGAHPYALDLDARAEEIKSTSRFGPVRHDIFPWTASHTSAEIRLFFASFSNWMALEDSVRNALLDDIEEMVTGEFGGVVQRPYLTAVYTAQRV